MLAEQLGLPQLTLASAVTVEGGTVTIRRDSDDGIRHDHADAAGRDRRATEKINEPRYPSFKGIMAAKKKPVDDVDLADLGVAADEVGLGAAWTAVVDVAQRRPARPRASSSPTTGEGGCTDRRVPRRQKFI